MHQGYSAHEFQVVLSVIEQSVNGVLFAERGVQIDFNNLAESPKHPQAIDKSSIMTIDDVPLASVVTSLGSEELKFIDTGCCRAIELHSNDLNWSSC